jgi:hypothetical protein
MPDKKQDEKQDIKLIELLTNKPSEPLAIENSQARVVFQAPAFADKYKGRSWSSKKLKEIGLEEEDDQDLAYYFRYWGTLNSYVTKILVEDSNGKIKLSDKTYSYYEFKPDEDLNYKFLFEKYVLEEMYPRGLDEAFVTSCIFAHMNWVRDRAMEEVDIKND